MASSEVGGTLSRTFTSGSVHIHATTYIVLAAINFASFAQLTAVVGSGLLAQQIQTLFGGQNESAWFAQAIAILTVVLGPPLSQLADFWGRKWIVTFAMIAGGVGSIITSRAQSMDSAIAGFVVIGIAFGVQALLYAIASEIVAREYRPLVQASVNFSAGFGAIIGIIMGGSLVRGGNYERYRIYFYILTGIFFVAAAAIAACYHPPAREEQITLTTGEKLRRLDWTGYLLFAAGLVLFCVALSWSRNPYPWSNVRIISTFVIGVVFIIAFCIYEVRFTKTGILDHRLFERRNFALSLITIFAEGLVFFAANAYFAYQVSLYTSEDLLISGLHFGVVFITSCCVAPLAGWYSSRTKSLRLPCFIGFAFLTIFNIVMATTTATNPGSAFWGFAVILGVGLGIILPTSIAIAQLSTPAELISGTSAIFVSMRSLGAVVGLAINNAIFNSTLSAELPTRVAAAVLPRGLPASSIGMLIGALTAHDQAALVAVPGVTPDIIAAAAQALVSAFGVAFRNCWIAASCFCIPALIATACFTDPQAEFTAHIDAPVEALVAGKQARLEKTHVITEESKSKSEEIEIV